MEFFRVRHRFFFFFWDGCQVPNNFPYDRNETEILFWVVLISNVAQCTDFYYFAPCTVADTYLAIRKNFKKKKKIHLKGPIWLGDVELSASIVKKFIRLFFFFFFLATIR